MTCKTTVVVIVGIISCFYPVWAAEREELLEFFEQEYVVTEKEHSEKTKTNVDLVGAAGNYCAVLKKQLFQALDYKLRHTAEASERLRILKDFYLMSQGVQKIHQTPRKGMGSSIGMYIYLAEANLMRRQIAILMLDQEAEKRWKRISNAPLILKEKTIMLDRGKASFKSIMYGDEVTLELILFPQDTFTCYGRDFVIIRTDIPFAVNDDFSTVYLCELKSGKIVVHTKLKSP